MSTITQPQKEIIKYLINNPEPTLAKVAASFNLTIDQLLYLVKKAIQSGYIRKEKEMRPMQVNMNGKLVTQRVNRVVLQPAENYLAL